MADELLPCPYCGGEASFENDNGQWSVGCDDKDGEGIEAVCMGYQSLTVFPRKSEAAAAWNRRALSAERDEAVRADKISNKLMRLAMDKSAEAIAERDALRADLERARGIMALSEMKIRALFEAIAPGSGNRFAETDPTVKAIKDTLASIKERQND